MPAIINSLELNDFYNGAPTFGASKIPGLISAFTPFGKSIQKSYRYTVTFFPSFKFLTSSVHRTLQSRIGKMPIIRSFHVLSVQIPQYKMKKDKQDYGPVPRSFCELDHTGFEVRITFEEDDKGTIGNFINWMQRSVVDSNGIYTPPDAYKIPIIGIVTENDFSVPICCYTLHDAFYLDASGPDLNYGTNESIKYEITFNCDIINSFFPQASIFQKLTSLII